MFSVVRSRRYGVASVLRKWSWEQNSGVEMKWWQWNPEGIMIERKAREQWLFSSTSTSIGPA